MPCPTCDHTLQSVSEDNSAYWCPRCGTLTDRNSRSATSPKLVERCRQLENAYIRTDEYPPLTANWRTLGIDEAINMPENRK